VLPTSSRPFPLLGALNTELYIFKTGKSIQIVSCKPYGNRPVGRQGVSGWIKQKWILKPQGVTVTQIEGFESGVLRRISGSKREGDAEGCRRPHNSYASPNITGVVKSTSMRWSWHIARIGDMRNLHNLVRKHEGKRPLRRSRRKWGDNIRMDLRETGWEVVDWTDLAHDWSQRWALVNAVMTLRFPRKAVNFLTR
jgi:hypothetical protein